MFLAYYTPGQPKLSRDTERARENIAKPAIKLTKIGCQSEIFWEKKPKALLRLLLKSFCEMHTIIQRLFSGGVGKAASQRERERKCEQNELT